MPVPALDLNEPARSLFARTVALLEQRLPPILPPDTTWCIGGGTVLAAQWQHRLSTDIDIFLPGRAGVAALSPQWDSAPQWAHLLSDGPRQAADIMDGFAYSHVALSCAKGTAFVFVETNRGEDLSWDFHHPQELLAGLYEMGLEEWVLANCGMTASFLVAAESEFASSRNDGGGDGSGGGMAGRPP